MNGYNPGLYPHQQQHSQQPSLLPATDQTQVSSYLYCIVWMQLASSIISVEYVEIQEMF